MMRSLWTAASGMTSQQTNVDVIANNLSNVNTQGYKKERLEFKSLLYETMKKADLDPGVGSGRPVALQVGHGVRPVATARVFSVGNLERTDQALDFAIEGPGFFTVNIAIPQGEENIAYTRDGALKLSPTDEGLMLVTSDGYPILDTENQSIILPEDVTLDSLSVDSTGVLRYMNEDGEMENLDIQINIVQFTNVQGLEAVGDNFFQATPASGEAILESEGDLFNTSTLRNGVLEMSNVQVADEMVNLIVAQRAYELNSKAITTSDSMLETANNLKR